MTSGRRSLLVVPLALAGYAGWVSLQASGSDLAETDAIGRISTAELCERIASGRPAIFVDVREPEEFAEEHIPHSVHMPVREMDERARVEIGEHELVVPYCLKDFRGFEGARRLVGLGFPQVRLLEGLGIRGWKAEGLPTAGDVVGRSDDVAWQETLARCEEMRP
jgi:rhodanese-related sulfurtransferase